MSKESELLINTLQRREANLSQLQQDIAVDSPRGFKIEETNIDNDAVLIQLSNLRESLATVFLPGLREKIAEQEVIAEKAKETAIKMATDYFAELEIQRTQLAAIKERVDAGYLSQALYEKRQAQFVAFEAEQTSSDELKEAIEIFKESLIINDNNAEDNSQDVNISLNPSTEHETPELPEEAAPVNNTVEDTTPAFEPDQKDLEFIFKKSRYPYREVLQLLITYKKVSIDQIKQTLENASTFHNFIRFLRANLAPIHLNVSREADGGTSFYYLETTDQYNIEEIVEYLAQYIKTQEDTQNIEDTTEEVATAYEEIAAEETSIADESTEDEVIKFDFLKKTGTFRPKLIQFFLDHPDAEVTNLEIQMITDYVLSTQESLVVGIKKLSKMLPDFGLKLENTGRRDGRATYAMKAVEGNSKSAIFEQIKAYLDKNNIVISYSELDKENHEDMSAVEIDTEEQTQQVPGLTNSSELTETQKIILELESLGITKDVIAHVAAVLVQSKQAIAAVSTNISDLETAVAHVNRFVDENDIILADISVEDRMQSLKKVIELTKSQESEENSLIHRLFREVHPYVYFLYIPFELEEKLSQSGEAAYGNFGEKEKSIYHTRLAWYLMDVQHENMFLTNKGMVLTSAETAEKIMTSPPSASLQRLNALRNPAPESVTQELPKSDSPENNSSLETDEEAFYSKYFQGSDLEGDDDNDNDEETEEDSQDLEEEDYVLEGLKFAYDVVAGMGIDPHDGRVINLTEIQNAAWVGKMTMSAERMIEPTMPKKFQGVVFKDTLVTNGKRHTGYTFHGLVLFTLAIEPSTRDLWMKVGAKLRKRILKRYVTEVI